MIFAKTKKKLSIPPSTPGVGGILSYIGYLQCRYVQAQRDGL